MLREDITLNTPEENILFDDTLLFLAEKGRQGEVLRFWESKQLFVVLGRIGKLNDDVHTGEVSKKKIPVLRRSSGGGTVVQGPGCLNYSLILSKDNHPKIRDLKKSYQYILDKVTASLEELGVQAEFMPVSDIASGGEKNKFSGNAQRRAKKFILHHGTILYNFDIKTITQYLKMPKEYPEYRRERGHETFVANIAVDPRQFKDVFAKSFNSTEFRDKLSKEEKNHLNLLLKEKKVIINV